MKCNWIEKNKDKINYIIEIWYPFALSAIILIIYLFLFRTNILDDKDNILNAVVSFSSILIGFIGTLIALLFSLENNLIAKFIFNDKHYKNLMKRYVVKSIESGFVLIVSSLALFFRNTISSLDLININIQPLNFTITLLYIIKLFWVFYLPYFGLSSYRIISIITKIAFNNLDMDTVADDKVFNNEDNFDIGEYEQIKKDYEMKRTEQDS